MDYAGEVEGLPVSEVAASSGRVPVVDVTPAAPVPHVVRCRNVLRDRMGFDLKVEAVEAVVSGDPGFVDRMRGYPRTGSLDGMDTCDKDRLMDLVSEAYLGSAWERRPERRKASVTALVSAVRSAGHYA